MVRLTFHLSHILIALNVARKRALQLFSLGHIATREYDECAPAHELRRRRLAYSARATGHDHIEASNVNVTDRAERLQSTATPTLRVKLWSARILDAREDIFETHLKKHVQRDIEIVVHAFHHSCASSTPGRAILGRSSESTPESTLHMSQMGRNTRTSKRRKVG